MTKRVAIIGGSKEAIKIAENLVNAGVDCVLFDTKSYASPNNIPSTRYTRDTDWTATLDGFDLAIIAPHPFAFDRVLPIANLALPQAAFCRPAWPLNPNWISVPDASGAAQKLKSMNIHRPLVAIGRERLGPLLDADIPGMQVRCKSEPLPDFHGKATAILMRGPVSVEDEIAYLRANRIDGVIAHNAGGKGGLPKLEAADQLNLPVILIARPDIPWKTRFDKFEALTAWLRAQGLDLRSNQP